LALDVSDKAACLKAFAGHAVVVHAAGPFADKDATVLEACLEAGCHYVDIADDRGYVSRVRSFDRRFRDKGLTAAYGCSSLPGLSEALAWNLREKSPAPVVNVRVTLFIGNRNAKGTAAVRSVFQVLGKKIKTPQGTITGFGDGETVTLPKPWGARRVYNFESPEYDLFPERFGAASVSVKLGFELRAVTRAFSLLAKGPESLRRALLRPLVRVGNLLNFLGSSGGAVKVEFSHADGSVQGATLFAPENGQRLAILPCVFVVRRLLSEGTEKTSGAQTAYGILGADLLRQVIEEGFEIRFEG
jgi:hypothetical protein